MKSRQSYIRKFSAGILLIVLLFIHSVKLLHSHAYVQVYVNHSAENPGQKIPLAESISIHPVDCVICSYHLGKDSDGAISFEQPIFISYNKDKSVLIFQSSYSILPFVIETRGPPMTI